MRENGARKVESVHGYCDRPSGSQGGHQFGGGREPPGSWRPRQSEHETGVRYLAECVDDAESSFKDW